jgi:hypothetical protein
MSSQGFILLYDMIFESLIWFLPYTCAVLMWQMICLPFPLCPLVTHPPQMKAHQLIRRQRCLIVLVVHLGSFANAPSVLVRFHKSHMFVLNTFSNLGSSWSDSRSFFISCGKCHLPLSFFPLWYMLFFMKSSLKLFSLPWFVVVFWM